MMVFPNPQHPLQCHFVCHGVWVLQSSSLVIESSSTNLKPTFSPTCFSLWQFPNFITSMTRKNHHGGPTTLPDEMVQLVEIEIVQKLYHGDGHREGVRSVETFFLV